jgi:hypothetical protein
LEGFAGGEAGVGVGGEKAEYSPELPLWGLDDEQSMPGEGESTRSTIKSFPIAVTTARTMYIVNSRGTKFVVVSMLGQ